MAKSKKNPFAPEVLETFRPPHHEVARLKSNEPACFNGMVHVQRYRVTVELIEEPAHVLEERLRALLATAKRVDSKREILAEAKRLGITLE